MKKALFILVSLLVMLPVATAMAINNNSTNFPFGHDDMQTRIEYNGSGDPLYIGRAIPGKAETEAVWQIRKITYDANGNVTEINFAQDPNNNKGTNKYGFRWDQRASYTY